MNYYLTKVEQIPGSNYKEVMRKAESYFISFRRKTKRQPYVRSAYFLKQKIFFNLFWIHLFQKPNNIRSERLKLLPCAIDLLQKSRIHPESKDNLVNKSEILHRFMGMTKDGVKFAVLFPYDF